jgi:PBP1b-binding outer membrane lipoprotein LpoB
MKKTSIVLIAVIILSFAACSGVSQEEHDRLQEQLDTLQEELNSLKNVDVLADEPEEPQSEEIEPEPEPESMVVQPPQTEPIVTTPQPPQTQVSSVETAPLETIGNTATIVYQADGPVVVETLTENDKIYADVDALGLDIMRMFENASPGELAPFARATRTGFSDLVSLLRGADLAQVIRLTNEFEYNLLAIKQTSENAGVSLSNVSQGTVAASVGYDRCIAIVQVLRIGIAEVEQERGVVSPEIAN